MSNKDKYGPPLEEPSSKNITTKGITTRSITAKQVLQSPPSSSLHTQNKFTPLTPLALPSFYPSPITPSQPRAVRPVIRSNLISPLEFSLKVPTSLNKTSEKLPFYTPPTNLSCPFIEKSYREILFLIEPEYQFNNSLLQTVAHYFPHGFHYLPASTEKNRLFYEFILVDTDSIEITHTYDKNDKQKIIFSKFKILRVLSPTDWEKHPSGLKRFSRKFTPQSYSYYDYMEAWTKMLLLESYDHSWFIWFKKDIPLQFPFWFIKWFNEWGPEPCIYPDYANRAFQEFIKEINIPDYMKILTFHASFGISWITSWTYRKELTTQDSEIYWVTRVIKIKWWNKFNPELIRESTLLDWFKRNPNYLIKPREDIKEGQFLAEKSKIMADLSSSSNKKEFFKKLQAAMSESELNEDKEDSVGSSQSITPNNEDDCYGINGVPDI